MVSSTAGLAPRQRSQLYRRRCGVDVRVGSRACHPCWSDQQGARVAAAGRTCVRALAGRQAERHGAPPPTAAGSRWQCSWPAPRPRQWRPACGHTRSGDEGKSSDGNTQPLLLGRLTRQRQHWPAPAASRLQQANAPPAGHCCLTGRLHLPYIRPTLQTGPEPFCCVFCAPLT